MKRIEKGNYIIWEDEKDDVKNFAAFLTKHYNSFQNENVVVNILKYGQLSLEELLSFLKLSDKHRKAKKSFVIVNDTINIDPVPEEMIVVPTLREAEDVIQMEDIERDLGF